MQGPRFIKLVIASLSLVLFANSALAQSENSNQNQQALTPAVTASATAGNVRFASPEGVLQMRLEIYNAAGEIMFDSGMRQGSILDWKVTDATAAITDGAYLCAVTVMDFQGQLRQRLGTLSLQSGELTLKRLGQGELTAAQSQTLNGRRKSQKIEEADDNASLTILRDGKERSAVVTVHDGENGQVTSTKGALTFGTGDTLTNRAKEQVRITPDGRVGIGTDKPEATLDVAGTVRASGGIQFADGTVLNSASGVGSKKPSSSGDSTTTAFAGTGTTGYIPKWTDGPGGVAGDSVIMESAGQIGIGTTNPRYPLHVAHPTFGQIYVAGGTAADFLAYHTNAPANARWTGFRSQNGRGKISSFADNGGYRVENIMTWDNATGNVSYGAAPGADKVEVAGNLRINGATNGIIFPDGTKMTSAATISTPAVQFVPAAEQLSVGDANGTAPMINLRGGSTCCSGPGGHTPAWFKVFQNGSFVATGNLGIGVSPMQGRGYRTSWDSYKGAFRSGYADNEWDDATVGFFSWAGGSNSTAEGLYSFAFGDTNFARSTSSIAFGSGNEVKGAAGFSAGAGNRVCDTYGVAFGNRAQSGGPLINGKCDPDSFNIRGLAAVAIGYNVTADQDHTTAMGKFASNNGFTGTFIWSDGSATASADTFRNTANNEFAARATGGFRFRTNLAGTTGCNLPQGSGVFNCTSSRYTKENFAFVNGQDVLARLRNVPVSTWNYISEGSNVRHMGPVAEDFYQAFGLGSSNTAIGVQDLAGVSLAAIKSLDERTSELQQKSAEVEQLRTQVSELRSANAALEQRLAALEQQATKKAKNKAKGRRD
jgi:hypothetical protein